MLQIVCSSVRVKNSRSENKIKVHVCMYVCMYICIYVCGSSQFVEHRL